jgi:large subunit ribosomal protein L25
MIQASLEANLKKASGKGVARKLRAAGMLPGVLYGKRTKTQPFYVDAKSFIRALLNAKGDRVLFNLTLKKDEETTNHLALIKVLDRHPVNEQIRHVDLYEVFPDQEVMVEVPVHFTGKAKGVEIEKGIMDVVKRTLKVSCLPLSIPKDISVDITNLSAGSALHASAVNLPEGVRLNDDPKTTLVTIATPEKETEAAK